MIALILAGGKGLRLWPESRRSRPKQLCALLDERSMLEQTIDRLRSAGAERIVIITGDDLAGEIAGRLLHRADAVEILSEPVGRNTAAAVGLGLAYCQDVDEKEIIGVFPADHHVGDENAFIQCMRRAQAAAEQGYLVTVGIRPERAETAYGYIERSRYEFAAMPEVYPVESFREKPQRDEAARYLATGDYMWNAGIYMGQLGLLKQEFFRFLPDIHAAAQGGYDHCRKQYAALPDISLDHGVAERSRHMAVVPGDFGWCDLGSWNTLSEVLPADEAGNCSSGGDVLLLESENCVVRQRHRSVVLFGVQDLVVVENDDVVMVTRRQCAQDLRRVTDHLEQQERFDLL
ncbi:MAG: sugar phosphate nucleotidyltransferase [Syntrophomonadaceae bacterium]|nr:sugar phosphate nucleotidyltransferase [Syntrophomonadaceae bacterium]